MEECLRLHLWLRGEGLFQTLPPTQGAASPFELFLQTLPLKKPAKSQHLLRAAQDHAYRLHKTWYPYLPCDTSFALSKVIQEGFTLFSKPGFINSV